MGGASVGGPTEARCGGFIAAGDLACALLVCLAGEEKLKLLKASSRPNDLDCVVGDRFCAAKGVAGDCDGGCAANDGAREYKERIDCFRSGLEGPLDGTAAALDGLAGGFACVPPKKSNPSSDSVGFEALAAGASTRGGAADVLGAAELGRPGRAEAVKSLKRSISCFRVSGTGCGKGLESRTSRLVEACPSCTFSLTTLRGYPSISVYCPSKPSDESTHHIVLLIDV